jgi:hypothetical protein
MATRDDEDSELWLGVASHDESGNLIATIVNQTISQDQTDKIQRLALPNTQDSEGIKALI